MSEYVFPELRKMSARKYCKMVAADMRAAGIREALIFAVIKTGMIVAEGYEHVWSDDDLKEWDDAIDEWEEGAVEGLIRAASRLPGSVRSMT